MINRHETQSEDVYESPNPGGRGQSERLTEAEARAVVALWAERQTEPEGLANTPTLADVAEGLGTSSQEASDLLREVRTRGLALPAENVREAASVLCQRCGDAMEAGEVVDQTYGAMVGQTWVPGKVQTSWLGALKTPAHQRKAVVTYCCPTCGLLESFARTP